VLEENQGHKNARSYDTCCPLSFLAPSILGFAPLLHLLNIIFDVISNDINDGDEIWGGLMDSKVSDKNDKQESEVRFRRMINSVVREFGSSCTGVVNINGFFTPRLTSPESALPDLFGLHSLATSRTFSSFRLYHEQLVPYLKDSKFLSPPVSPIDMADCHPGGGSLKNAPSTNCSPLVQKGSDVIFGYFAPFSSPLFRNCNSFVHSFLCHRYVPSPSNVMLGTANHYFNTCKFSFSNMGNGEDVVKLGVCMSRFILYIQYRWRSGKLREMVDSETVTNKGDDSNSKIDDGCSCPASAMAASSSSGCGRGSSLKESRSLNKFQVDFSCLYDKKLYHYHPTLLKSFNMLLSFLSYIPSPSRLTVSTRSLHTFLDTLKSYYLPYEKANLNKRESVIGDVEVGRDTPLHLFLMGLSTVPSHLLFTIDSTLLRFHVMHSPPPSFVLFFLCVCLYVFVILVNLCALLMLFPPLLLAKGRGRGKEGREQFEQEKNKQKLTRNKDTLRNLKLEGKGQEIVSKTSMIDNNLLDDSEIKMDSLSDTTEKSEIKNDSMFGGEIDDDLSSDSYESSEEDKDDDYDDDDVQFIRIISKGNDPVMALFVLVFIVSLSLNLYIKSCIAVPS
jgi:hypothetical protein